MTTLSLHSLAIAGAVGLLSGTHAAIWGMYKDAIHEGFTAGRFTRSPIVGVAVAVAIQATLGLGLPGAAALVTLFGLAYAAERGAVEVWKTFVREERQSKYTIPMQFSVRGVPVAGRGARLAAGAAYIAAVALCLLAIARLDPDTPTPPSAARSALAGLVVGLVVAIGGAWKDAPTEGFDVLKFWRSPALTVVFALLLSLLTESYLQAAVAAIGYERATTETYKTFRFPTTPPGKFAGKPVLHPEMRRRRRRYVPAFAAIWAAVLVWGAVALRDAATGERAAVARSVGTRP